MRKITAQELLDRKIVKTLTPFQQSIFDALKECNDYQLGKFSVCFPEYVEAFEMIKIHTQTQTQAQTGG